MFSIQVEPCYDIPEHDDDDDDDDNVASVYVDDHDAHDAKAKANPASPLCLQTCFPYRLNHVIMSMVTMMMITVTMLVVMMISLMKLLSLGLALLCLKTCFPYRLHRDEHDHNEHDNVSDDDHDEISKSGLGSSLFKNMFSIQVE